MYVCAIPVQQWNLLFTFRPKPENTNAFKQLSQKSYKAAASEKAFKGKSLSKLLIEGFDEEQIWQQSDLLNEATSLTVSAFIRDFDPRSILSTISKNSKSKPPPSANLENSIAGDDNELLDNGDSDVEERYAFDDDSDVPIQEENDNEGYAFDDDSDLADEIETHESMKPSSQKKSKYKSAVDDQFFKLSNLENFLKSEDIKEERGDEYDGTSEDDMNLFQEIPSDDDDSDEEFDENKVKTKKVYN